MKKTFILFLQLVLLFPTLLMAQSSTVIDQKLAAIMQQYQAVGLSVVLVKNNKISFHKNYGYKQLAEKKALQDDDIFRIASISKSFTATSFMQLVAKGICKLDDDFGDLVGFPVRNPEYPDAKITLRMILSHTSSINDSNGYFNLDVINPSKNPNWKKSYNSYKPGSRYEYCNLNFNMAGAALERLTQTRFDSYIVHHILSPLHLYGGYCVDSLDKNRFVPLYSFDGKGNYRPEPNAYHPRREELSSYHLGYSTPVLSPTGGMKISAMDLARYMLVHMNYGKSQGVSIMPRRYAKLMQKSVNKDAGYGLAIMNKKDVVPGVTLTGHTGSAYGLYSAMFFDAKRKYGFVVITNGCNIPDNDDFNPLLRDCIRALHETYIQ
ncbi:beta-lactamase family protein [Sphingobacterium sp. InxBP1]|uniref:serine hydrolase domain-containing protein n=1 Tax=Sphingobacterium sp. InxBP1 TaxID=2870328 RepID=UPI002244B65E|nr:serine hydrolase domain-containing protein [Sphingobacterium sp. InxBP1]MCW8309806.1 beta-lactamase family protein [Sphingobacterium sp. InxBP1]